MKKLSLVIAISTLLFTTCQKSEEDFWAKYTAGCLINGENRVFIRVNYSTGANSNGKATISLNKFNEFNELRQELSIINMTLAFDKKIPLKFYKAGFTKDSATAFLYTYGADGDALTEHYDILENNSTDNWVKLKKKSENEIEGTFQIAFHFAKYGNIRQHFDLPDTFFITNGTFTARLRK
jgi:hypothetical protein